MAESEEELKSLLMRMKKESETARLKLNIQKTKIMASITSQQTDGETMETVTDFMFLDSKTTADSDYSHEIKRCLLLGRKTMTNLDKAMFYLAVMCGCESWTIKKAERWRIDAFELWCWRRLLRVPWTCKEIQPVNPKGNQFWIFTGRTDAEVEAPILWPPDEKGRLIGIRAWCWESLRAGGEGDNSGWDGWMALWTQWTWIWVSSGSCWCTGKPGMLQFMRS